jgi:hypothetical protein
MYRRTRKTTEARARQLAAMQRGRELARLEGPAPDYPAELPALRMRITIERFDLATPERHVFELRRCHRVDQYAVHIDGKPWKVAGLSAVLAGLRKATPRMLSSRALG